MTEEPKAFDRLGKPVHAGSRVRVLSIAEFLARDLPADEYSRLLKMVGKVLDVTEIDQWGGAWVEMQFAEDDDHVSSHSLSLSADEMELVSDRTSS